MSGRDWRGPKGSVSMAAPGTQRSNGRLESSALSHRLTGKKSGKLNNKASQQGWRTSDWLVFVAVKLESGYLSEP